MPRLTRQGLLGTMVHVSHFAFGHTRRLVLNSFFDSKSSPSNSLYLKKNHPKCRGVWPWKGPVGWIEVRGDEMALKRADWLRSLVIQNKFSELTRLRPFMSSNRNPVSRYCNRYSWLEILLTSRHFRNEFVYPYVYPHSLYHLRKYSIRSGSKYRESGHRSQSQQWQTRGRRRVASVVHRELIERDGRGIGEAQV